MTRGKRLAALEAAHAARHDREEGERRAQVARLSSSPDFVDWEDLQGKTAAQLEDLARRMGLAVPDLAGRSAADLTRLYFEGWPA